MNMQIARRREGAAIMPRETKLLPVDARLPLIFLVRLEYELLAMLKALDDGHRFRVEL